MKKLMTLMLMAAFAMPALAQITHTSKGDDDENAEKILKKASQKINAGAVSFSVTMISKDQNKKETGKMKADVLYNKGKYRVDFDENVIYCDGNSTWHWNKEVDEVVINKMSSSEDDLLNPASILANYGKNFKAKFIRQEKDGTAIIDMTPKKSKSYYKIRLKINANSGIIQSMEMHNYDGSCGEYKVSNFKSGVKTSDSDFTFSKSNNPKVEIIDMR